MPLITVGDRSSFPLRKIFLRNFKSVKEAVVSISPLTVVVGANSSGKSTLLQSVLSIAQATSKDLNGTNFPLNGERIMLGSFAETKSFFASDDEELFQIGFELESIGRFLAERQLTGFADRPRLEVLSYNAIFKFDLVKSESLNSGSAQVSHISIDAQRDTEIGSKTSQQLMKINLNFATDPQSDGHRRMRHNCSGTVYDSITSHTYSVSAAEFVGLIPTTLSEKGDSSKFAAETIVRSVEAALKAELDDQKTNVEKYKPSNDKDLEKIESSAIQVFDAIFEDMEIGEVPNFELMQEHDEIAYFDYHQALVARIKNLKSVRKKEQLAALVAWSNIERITQELKRSSGLPWVRGEVLRVRDDEVKGSLRNLANLTQRLFRSATTYLGPIRMMPRVNYDPSTGRTDVGPCGEYTAFVLHTTGRNERKFPLPDGTQQWVSLNTAVNAWLEFFGLARGAKTTDKGRLGIGLSINLLDGGYEVDLTSVGVGVSQVLPVIVSCLMAKPGSNTSPSSITLIEQPELHLHPKLQMDLADFLIACVNSGRQIIIETHSEHLVNRLRRRIAEDEGGHLGDFVGILFAEQKNGVTQYRSPSINKFGGLGSDWPDGFLEVGAEEMGNLLEAGMSKRMKSSE